MLPKLLRRANEDEVARSRAKVLCPRHSTHDAGANHYCLTVGRCPDCYGALTTNGTQTQFDLHGIKGIAVDGSGNVYVAGERSDNNANFAAVMIKLNSTGSTALFTFVGEGLSSTRQSIGALSSFLLLSPLS